MTNIVARLCRRIGQNVAVNLNLGVHARVSACDRTSFDPSTQKHAQQLDERDQEMGTNTKGDQVSR
jgi:hypothetical protein